MHQPTTAPIVCGAIFDFAGWLTTRSESVTCSGAHDAGPMVELIREWAELRGLSLDDANVLHWTDHISGNDPWAPSTTTSKYDMSIHSNPNAYDWSTFFVRTFPGLADKQELMHGWFANAMMAMHDFLTQTGLPDDIFLEDDAETVEDDAETVEDDASTCFVSAIKRG